MRVICGGRVYGGLWVGWGDWRLFRVMGGVGGDVVSSWSPSYVHDTTRLGCGNRDLRTSVRVHVRHSPSIGTI